jgi:hypothetical protein
MEKMNKDGGNTRPKAGSGRRMVAVSLSNHMMAIELVFVHANEIPPRLPINVLGFQECNVLYAMRPSARTGIT